MKKWREIVVNADISILQAIDIIDRGAMQIALVVNEEGRLIGTLSDGDVRRVILKGISLESPVNLIMNAKPVSMPCGSSREAVLELMRKMEVRQIPIVDGTGKLMGLELWQEVTRRAPIDNPVILMAGGAGKRLGELTEYCPKPLLKVGNKPILQTILESFIECGFQNFYFSVNYRAEMIRTHFGNGDKWGVQIQYLHEEFPLGTAGALGLLPEKPTVPIIVMNGDILTKVDFEHLLTFHKVNQSCATMCIRDYQTQVPYGVVEIEEHRLLAIHEKPIQQFFVSAGIYVFNPDIFDFLPAMGKMDMPELFNAVMKGNKETIVFPIREYWIDIGRVDDYEKANGDFETFFSTKMGKLTE
ncbi:MAG: nucleotidyltransferase family protein [Negativicutes bacterium]